MWLGLTDDADKRQHRERDVVRNERHGWLCRSGHRHLDECGRQHWGDCGVIEQQRCRRHCAGVSRYRGGCYNRSIFGVGRSGRNRDDYRDDERQQRSITDPEGLGGVTASIHVRESIDCGRRFQCNGNRDLD